MSMPHRIAAPTRLTSARTKRNGLPTSALELGGLLVAAALCLAAAAGAQDRLIFTEYQYNNPKLKSMNLDGTDVGELFVLPPAEWLPVGCDYDAAGGKVYWTHGSTPGTIRRANLDGSEMELLLTGLKIPRGISVDADGGKLYWVQAPPQGNALGLLKRANLDGTGVETVYAIDPYDPVLSYVGKPTADPVNGYIYFCSQGAIRRVKLDGTGYVQTVVRGVTTVTAVALDVAANRIYFLDANTNSDYIGRAHLDNTGFEVVFDNTPGVAGTSGLFDFNLDLVEGRCYFTDELQKTIRRADLDGTGVELLYTSPSGLTPTAVTLNERPPQPILDCNNNGIRDLDDIESGYSQDCNFNGIPDECEDNPCVPEAFFLDNGSDPTQSHRVLSGDPVNGYEIFQPFDVADPEIHLTRLDLDGYTMVYEPQGFRATVFPDDGTGSFPDETQPLGGVDFQYRFSTNTEAWERRPLDVTLTTGRYWVRLTAYDPTYDGAACVGTSGLPSLSRRSDGTIYTSSHSIAVRLKAGDPAAAPGGEVHAMDAGLRIARIEPHPVRTAATITFALPHPAEAELSLVDLLGRVARVWTPGMLAAGEHRLRWDGLGAGCEPLPSGIYFLRLAAGGRDATRAVVVF